MAKEKLHAPPDASHAVYPTHQLHVTCSESIIDHEIIFCVYISDSIWFSLFDTYLLKGSRRSLSLLQRALPPAKQKIHMVGGLPFFNSPLLRLLLLVSLECDGKGSCSCRGLEKKSKITDNY